MAKYLEFVFIAKQLSSIMNRQRFRSMCDRIQPTALCPTYNLPVKIFTFVLLWALGWGLAYTLLRNNITPGSSLFMMISLFTSSYIVANIIELIKIPPMIGMILVGIAMRNLGLFQMDENYQTVERILRTSTLVTLLIRAGLILQCHTVWKLHELVFKLGVIPFITEAICVMILSFIMLDFPWLWGALLGCVLAASAPGIIIPMVLTLEEKGYGKDKSIATIVIAASSIDNIMAITAFGIILYLLSNTASVVDHLYYGPGGILLGLSFGIVWGIISIYIPHRNSNWLLTLRCMMLAMGGLFAVHGCYLLGLMGGGPIACVLMSFIAGTGWRRLEGTDKNPVDEVFKFIWKFCVHVLFSLIGTTIDFSTINVDIVIYGCVIIITGTLVREAFSFLSLYGDKLNRKEMLFISITWLSKATVQAVLGPLTLDVAEDGNERNLEFAKKVLTMSVLCILITAPLGAVIIHITGPILLQKSETIAESAFPLEETIAETASPQDAEIYQET